MSPPPSGGDTLPQPRPHDPQAAAEPGLSPAAAESGPSPAPASAEPSGQSLRPVALHVAPPSQPEDKRHLLWRARKDAKPVVALWLTPTADGCELSSDVYPLKSLRVDPVHVGPYRFRHAEDAQAFAQEAALALMHLGCEVSQDERSAAGTGPTPNPAPSN